MPDGAQVAGIDTLILLLSFAACGVWIAWIVRHIRQALYAVPPLTWLVNVILFYLTLPLHAGLWLQVIWLGVIRLHAAFLLLGIGAVMLLERIIVKDPGP